MAMGVKHKQCKQNRLPQLQSICKTVIKGLLSLVGLLPPKKDPHVRCAGAFLRTFQLDQMLWGLLSEIEAFLKTTVLSNYDYQALCWSSSDTEHLNKACEGRLWPGHIEAIWSRWTSTTPQAPLLLLNSDWLCFPRLPPFCSPHSPSLPAPCQCASSPSKTWWPLPGEADGSVSHTATASPKPPIWNQQGEKEKGSLSLSLAAPSPSVPHLPLSLTPLFPYGPFKTS